MTTIQASEAKTRLAELLRAVERGESFEITRHGKVIAQLAPPSVDDEADRAARRAAIERFKAMRGTLPKMDPPLTAEEIRAARDEGRM